MDTKLHTGLDLRAHNAMKRALKKKLVTDLEEQLRLDLFGASSRDESGGAAGFFKEQLN